MSSSTNAVSHKHPPLSNCKLPTATMPAPRASSMHIGHQLISPFKNLRLTNEQPIPTTRLAQIATDACVAAFDGAEVYDHSKTEVWNTTIIVSCA